MMINGFDINPLATEMHLREIEGEVRRARAGTRNREGKTTMGSGRTLVGRLLEWWKRPVAAHDVAIKMR